MSQIPPTKKKVVALAFTL